MIFRRYRNLLHQHLRRISLLHVKNNPCREGHLPVAAIYGANASGKSNIYNAFEYMSEYVAESFKYGDEEEKFEEFRPTPFLFDSTSADAESSFEVCFTGWNRSIMLLGR